jgi:salicylate hydroxylase
MRSFVRTILHWSSTGTTLSSPASLSSSSVIAVSVVLYLHLQQQVLLVTTTTTTTVAGILLPLRSRHAVPSGFISSTTFDQQRSIHYQKPSAFEQLLRNHGEHHSLRHIARKQTNRPNYRRLVTTAIVKDINLEERSRFHCSNRDDSLRTMPSNIEPEANIFVDNTQERQQMLWKVCNKCHGEGRMYHRSRKARRLKTNNDNAESDTNSSTPTTPIDGSNVSVTICKFCQGSGLMQKQHQNFRGNETQSTDGPKRRPIHIAVIGGGIGGLAFAAACQHRNIHVTVYERDTHFTQRKQGYGLTLQQASKQLMGLGILPESLTSSGSPGITSTKHIVHDENGNVKGTWGLRHWLGDDTVANNNTISTGSRTFAPSEQSKGDKCRSAMVKCDDMDVAADNGNKAQQSSKQKQSRRRQNIHIARQALRYELYLAATANELIGSNGQNAVHQSHSSIQWNHRLVKYDEGDDGVELTFVISGDNETTTPVRTVKSHADIVVGADGIRSQVRQQFFGSEQGTQLRYLDCIVILGICPLSVLDANIIQSSPFRHLLDGQTVFQTADGVTRIYMMPYSRTEYMWQLSFPLSMALRDVAISRCHTWHTPIPDILKCTPIDMISGYPVYDRDLVQPHQLQRHDHPHPRRITFIGDAIHCMSPFKGQGANQALLDALSLARYLYKAIRLADNLSSAKEEICRQSDNALKKQKLETDEPSCQLNGNDIEKILEQYEQEMLSRSAVKVKASADAAHFLHTNIAIQEGDITRGMAAAISETCQKSS